MVGKRQRKSRRRKLLQRHAEEKLLENESEENLRRKIAEIQAELNEVARKESANEENNEPERNQRTRLGSPFPSARSPSPDSENYNEVNKSDHPGSWGNQPFYKLPVNEAHPSTSKGYSHSLDTHFYTEKGIRKDPDFFKNLRSSREKNSPVKNQEDSWVPLTFVDSLRNNLGSTSTDSKSMSRPKILDLRRHVVETKRPPEEIPKSEDFEVKPQEIKIERSRQERRERKKLKRIYTESISKQEMKFKNPLYKMRKRETEFFRRCSLESNSGTSSGPSEPLKEEMKIKNPLAKMKKRDTDSYRRYSKDSNSESHSGTSEEIRNKETNSFIKLRNSVELNAGSHSVENPEVDQSTGIKDFNPFGIIPTELLFNACVSIASVIPEEALISLKNLRIPEVKVNAKEPEVITIDDSLSENSGPISREREIENVAENSIKNVKSVSSKEQIFEAVLKSLIEEKLQEGVGTKSRESSRESSVEKSENTGRKIINFGEEIEKFMIKLKIIKRVEEGMKES